MPIVSLADRDRMDGALHRPNQAWCSEHEEELVGLIRGQLGGLDIFQNIHAPFRQK